MILTKDCDKEGDWVTFVWNSSFCETVLVFLVNSLRWKVRCWFNFDQSRPAKVLRLGKSDEVLVGGVANGNAPGGLKELVLQVHGCPLTEETITHLEVFIQWIRAKGGPIETWIDIEGTNLKNSSSQCLQCFRCFASSSRFKASQRSVAESKTSYVITNDSSDMPFPCSHNGCFRFHSNAHGFCQEHRWSRFTNKIVPALKTVWNWLQLLMLLLAQASVEIQDRWLLMLILMSLLPTATLFLQKDIGWFSTCFSIPLFVGMLGSWIQIGQRFDKMQRAMLELLLTTEAMYLGNLQATGEGAHQGLLFDEDVAGDWASAECHRFAGELWRGQTVKTSLSECSVCSTESDCQQTGGSQIEMFDGLWHLSFFGWCAVLQSALRRATANSRSLAPAERTCRDSRYPYQVFAGWFCSSLRKEKVLPCGA